jgi:hypothetical protein
MQTYVLTARSEALLKHDAMAISSYRLNASSSASATDSHFSPLDMHSRNYSYPPPGYSGSNASPPPSNNYSSAYEQSSGRPYYPAASSGGTSQLFTQTLDFFFDVTSKFGSDTNQRSTIRRSLPLLLPLIVTRAAIARQLSLPNILPLLPIHRPSTPLGLTTGARAISRISLAPLHTLSILAQLAL